MSPELQRILESKRAHRKQLAAKPIAEKLRIVEQLAARARTLRKSDQENNDPAPLQTPKPTPKS